MTTEERLEKLESELVRAKHRNRRLLAVLVGVVVAAVVILAISGPPDTFAQAGTIAADKDRAISFAVVKELGSVPLSHNELGSLARYEKTQVYVLWANGAVTTPAVISPRGSGG